MRIYHFFYFFFNFALFLLGIAEVNPLYRFAQKKGTIFSKKIMPFKKQNLIYTTKVHHINHLVNMLFRENKIAKCDK